MVVYPHASENQKIDVITDGCNFANTFPVRMTINNQTGGHYMGLYDNEPY